MSLDHHNFMQDLPHYRDRYEAAKKLNVYFIPAYDEDSSVNAFFYVLASASLHDEMVSSLKQGVIPNFAVVVESGFGEPTTEIKDKIKNYYGFDHDLAASNDNQMIRLAAAN
jgi:hypothetical protein